MTDFNTIRRPATTAQRAAVYDEGLRAYMNKVYGLMTAGMLVTAVVAWSFAQMAGGPGAWTEFGRLVYTTPLRWVILFLPLVMVFAFGAAIQRLSTQAVTMLFYAFSAVMGASISSIFLRYTGSSIAATFVATAAGFAALSLYGYTTKRDLSAMGRFMMIGLVGLIVAMIVNIFVGSGLVQLAISAIGVLIFAGLTAYDTQNIKNTYLELANSDPDFLGKSAIMGALTLYLDFLNLFQFLLSFMGQQE
ncbi:MAG TPA: Bax inhibitor-1/YccA family protein [Paracoccus solventivorans]|uniref:Bax inhibitor-1/YccA family protein n=1 Tax=Paracoccus solventivorans TaxID=53463 RepID=A0A832PKC1_9RHOB|nr:Bax inhibitor-1/YccA family protein [Paracoccus solventivorans]HHW32893.1 Bax inhibitor-1/YccA family protein [Paracoccus solventivorans]HMM10039.1 Bax inhibitor-1/YccA family protein [Paracoccus solventivorans]